MRVAVQMPQLGFDMPTGTIAGWVASVGDRIAKGDVIAEVETEKTTVGLEALSAGTLVEIVQPAGAEVAIGEVIAWLDDA